MKYIFKIELSITFAIFLLILIINIIIHKIEAIKNPILQKIQNSYF